jgi:hypothetical protein
MIPGPASRLWNARQNRRRPGTTVREAAAGATRRGLRVPLSPATSTGNSQNRCGFDTVIPGVHAPYCSNLFP